MITVTVAVSYKNQTVMGMDTDLPSYQGYDTPLVAIMMQNGGEFPCIETKGHELTFHPKI